MTSLSDFVSNAEAAGLTDNLLTAVANNVNLTAGNHDRVDGTSGVVADDTVTLPAAPEVGAYGEFFNGSTEELVLAKDAGDSYLGMPSSVIQASSGFSWRCVAANTIEVVGTGEAGGPTTVPDWAATTEYEDAQLVQRGHLTLRAEGGHTSGATFDVTEATNWIVISQYRIPDWAPATVYVQAQLVTYQGNIYVCAGGSFTSAATFTLGNFVLEVEANEIKDWTADTRFEVGSLVRYGNMILRRQFDVGGGGASESTFDATEAARWEVLTQEGYSSWAQNQVYVAGEKILVNGEVYSRNVAGSDSGAAFYVQAADWTLVTEETDYSGYTDYLLSGLKDAATGTGYRYRVTGYREQTQGYRYSLTDSDNAAATTHEIDLDTRSWAAADTYQIQLTFIESALSNQVVEVGYSDGGGNSTTKLVNIGTGNIGVVAGGTDVGNVASVISVAEVNRGRTTKDIEVNLILSWTGASGGSPVITVKPSYNSDGTAVEDVAASNAVTIVRAKTGAVSDFPAASDVVATLFDSSGGPVAETLPTATGSGAVLFFGNKDVSSNAVTLAPAAGESINGLAADALFYPDSYADNTTFKATDVAAGRWSVEVVGAPTSTERDPSLIYYFEGAFDQLDPTNADNIFELLPLSSAVAASNYGVDPANNYDPEGMLNGSDGLDISGGATGRWVKVLHEVHHPADQIAGGGGNGQGGEGQFSAFLRIFDGEDTRDYQSDYLGTKTGAGDVAYMTQEFIVPPGQTWTLSTGFDITVDDGAGDLEDLWSRTYLYDLKPQTQTVLAGHVKPTTLDRFMRSRSTFLTSALWDTVNTPLDATVLDVVDVAPSTSNIVDNGDGTVTLKAGNSYKLTANVLHFADATSNTADTFYQWHDGSAYVGSKGASVSRSDSGGGFSPAVHFTGLLGADTTFSVRNSDLDNTGNTFIAGTKIVVEMVPVSSVVLPDAVPVLDLELGKISKSASQTIANNASSTIEFETVDYDTNSIADTANNRIVLVTDGWGEVTANLKVDTPALTGDIEVAIRVNGSTIAREKAVIASINALDSVAFNLSTGAIQFSAGDIVDLVAVNGLDASATVSGGVTNNWLAYRQIAAKTITYVDPAFTEAKDLDVYAAHWDASQIGTDHPSTVVTPASTTNIVDNGDRSWTLSNGRFKVEWWPTLDQGSSTAGQRITVDGSPVGLYGDRITENDTSAGNGSPAFAYVDATSSSKVVSTQSNPFAVDEFHKIRIEQLPSKEYVTPGDVPVEDLDYQFIRETAPTPVGQIQVVSNVAHAGSTTLIESASRIDLSTPTTSNGTGVTVGANDMTVGSDGRYSFTADVVTITTENATQSFSYSYVQLVKNGTEILATSHESADVGSTTAGRTRGHTLVWGGDLSSGDTLDVRIQGHSITGTFVSSYSILLKQEPTKTAINTTDYQVSATGHAATDALDSQYKVVKGNREYADIEEIFIDVSTGVLANPGEVKVGPTLYGQVLSGTENFINSAFTVPVTGMVVSTSFGGIIAFSPTNQWAIQGRYNASQSTEMAQFASNLRVETFGNLAASAPYFLWVKYRK